MAEDLGDKVYEVARKRIIQEFQLDQETGLCAVVRSELTLGCFTSFSVTLLVHPATCRIPFGIMTRRNNSLFLFTFVLLIELN